MDVVSTCPLRVSSVTWQPWPGVWAFTVVCKATFRLEPGAAPLAEAQEAPAEDDVLWGSNASASLFAPADFVPLKARADILLVGNAFAPRGQPARSLIARLAVGEVDKRVEVWCDRIFWHQGQVLEGSPFVKMPLRYERAAGGPDTWNPVGMRLDAPLDDRGAVPIPNLQLPGLRDLFPGASIQPVGFGPIAPSWPERTAKLPKGAAGWSPRAWREQALPKNFDPSYFNAAPRDQQAASIRADERITLENLHPHYERLETRLPGLRPKAAVTGPGRVDEEVPLTCDTLWIDTDRAIATVVWRGRVGLTSPQEAGRVVVSMEGPGVAAAAPISSHMGALGGDTAPFPGAADDEEEGATLALEPEPVDEADLVEESGTVAGAAAGGPSLPFGPAKSPWAAFPQKAPAIAVPLPPEDTGTAIGVSSPGREVLPFPGSEKPIQSPPPAALQPLPPPVRAPFVREEIAAPAMVAPEPRAPEVTEPAAEPPPAEISPPITEPSLDEFPLERGAAIAASIARRKADEARILEQNKLDAAAWAALDQRFRDAIREDIERGKTRLLEAYDAAYVEQLERERGPIQLNEYARLVVAAERGTLAAVLAKMGLPRGAMLRIERAWLRKMAGDAELEGAVRRAVKSAREE